jgi:hypothetical protein
MDARRKPFHPVTTKSNPKHAVAPNLLGQDFTAERPNARVDGGYYVRSDHTGMVVPGGYVGCVSKMNASTGLFITLVTTQGSLCLNTWRCFITGKGDIRLWAISVQRPLSSSGNFQQKTLLFFDRRMAHQTFTMRLLPRHRKVSG